ncbi:MFS transporter [Pseudomonas sp. LRF_L74]|uniref:MFS transporter n=1 Tax=Pseudomonas sp. LRF_L74 TaxID=3369422 RepID=UPI003F63AF50
MGDAQTKKGGAGILIAACMLLFAASDIGSWMAPETVSQFMSYPGFDEERAGLLLTIELSATFLVILLCSQFAGRFPYRAIALLGILLAVGGQYLSHYHPQFWLMVVIRCAVGTGIGLTSAVAVMALSTVHNAEKHFPKLYVFDMCSGALFLSVLVYMKSIATALGASHFFIIPGTLLLIVGALALLGLPSSAKTTPVQHSNTENLPRVLGFTNRSAFLLVLGAYALCCGSAISYTFSHFIGEQAKLGPDQVNSILGLSTFVAIPSGLLCVYLAGRGNQFLIVALAIAVHSTGNILMTHFGHYGMFTPGMVFSLAAIYFCMPFMQGLGVEYDPRGGCSAAVLSAFPASFAIAGSLGGYLFARYSVETIGWIIVSADMLGGLMILFAIILFKSSKSGAKPALAPEEEGYRKFS